MDAFRRRAALLARPAVVAVLLVLLGAFAGGVSAGTVQIWTFVAINVLLAQSVNLLTGVAGQISLGHAAFLGIGAYGSALLMKHFGVPLPLTLVAVLLAGALAGWLLSFAAGRVREFYLAMMTLGFGMIFYEVAREWTDLTGGVIGLAGVPSPGLRSLRLFGVDVGPVGYFRIVLGVAAVAVWMLHNLLCSPYGRALFAIHASEVAAGSIGVPRERSKREAYALSAALAALAGAFYAHLVGYLGPDAFGMNRSVEALVMAVVGGLGSLAGPVLGAVVFTVLPEQLQMFADWQYVVYGVTLTVSFALLPRGLSGFLLPRRSYVRAAAARRRAAAASVPAAAPGRADAAAAPEPLLRADGIVKSFMGVRALDGISIEIAPGRIVGLVGPNGSGKSTLVNVVSGIYRPDAGSVRFDGRPITGARDHEVAGLGVLRTFQDPRLVPGFTVRENVLLGLHRRCRQGRLAAALGLPSAVAEDATMLAEVDAALALTGLEAQAETPVRELPYGDQRMTELARVLVAGARVAMLDEPAAGLSEVELERLALVVRELRSRGVAIVLVEHHLEFLEDLVDEVVVLDAGRCIYRGEMKPMYRNPEVIAAYLGNNAESGAGSTGTEAGGEGA